MGYESLSTVVVLVILMVIAVGWLPRRTVNSMKKVAEHRQDRYSSSLHLVDADSGTRFSDEHTPQPKGAIMQRAQTSTTTPTTAKVAHIRELRRAAVRRRRILALSLLLITVLVLVLSMVLPFSALFALIPGVLLALFLVAVNTGSLKVTPLELFKGLFIEYNENVATIYDLRFPRILIAIFGGAATAVSGVLLQAVMKMSLSFLRKQVII